MEQLRRSVRKPESEHTSVSNKEMRKLTEAKENRAEIIEKKQ